MKNCVIITGETLTLREIHTVCCHDVPVVLSEEARERILASRRTVDALPFMLLLYTQTALLLVLTLPFLGGFQMTWKALLAVAGLAVGCTLLGHSMFTLALGKVSATVVSFALLGEPVGAMLWSMVMFGEIPTPLLFVGGSVTIIGLVLYLMGSMGMMRKKQ